jgi:hypothetical protein
MWRWHITETIVFPPLDPNDPPPTIIRFKWWKRLLLWMLVFYFFYCLWNGSFIQALLLLVLPVRLHWLIAKAYDLYKNKYHNGDNKSSNHVYF